MTAHPLDREFAVKDQVMALRFSMRSLAIISRELDANSPLQFAKKLRTQDPIKQAENMRLLFQSMCLESAPELNAKALLRALPILAEMIEEAFA